MNERDNLPMNQYLEVDRTFFPKNEKKLHALDLINSKYLENVIKSKRPDVLPSYYWPAERYGLERSTHFQKLDLEAKERILRQLSIWNLNLSYFIETSGAHYSAKMILLSNTKQEKALYSIFAHDELLHQQEFVNFMPEVPLDSIDFHPLLRPLGRALKESGREVLIYIVQVLLEGFGLNHYASLKRDCLSFDLKDVFTRILIDEARHHGAGLILRQETHLTKEELDQIFELSREFIHALQDANWAIKAMQLECGNISQSEHEKISEEIDLPKIKELRRLKLKELINHSLPQETFVRLDAEKIF